MIVVEYHRSLEYLIESGQVPLKRFWCVLCNYLNECDMEFFTE